MKLAACGNTSGLETSIINNNGIKIYPNPSKNKINIKANKKMLQIDLIDIYGQMIQSKYTQKKELSFSANTLPSGLYFIKVTLNNGSSNTVKMIKE